MTFEITSLLHVGFIVADVKISLNFYIEVLGLGVDPKRPDLGYPGAWINIGKQQIHLMQLPNPDANSARPDHGGRDRHVAFSVTPIDKLIERLEGKAIPFTRSRSGRKAIFFRDPDGNALEFSEQG